MLSDFLVSKYF